MDMPLRIECGELDLDSVIATSELSRRPPRPPDHKTENGALVALAEEIAISPEGILQRLVDRALELCEAHSAGITLVEQGTDGQAVLRWRAVAGRFAGYLGNLMPRDFSPCGVVLDDNSPRLFVHPERYYSYIRQIDPPVVEALLIPFCVGGEPVGTIWVVIHGEHRGFDAEDLRVMGNLAKFAGAAYQVMFSLEALQKADHRKDEFLAVLAHELRNPLAPIRSAVQILRHEGTPTAELCSARDVIDRQVGQMTHLIDDLLDVSRISHGRIELRRERVELAEVVRSALEATHPLIESSGHRLDVELPPEPIPLEGDPTRLAQVFSNLLNNAAKYTERGGQIRLAAELAGHHVRVRVTDSGIGISPAQLPNLFKMFTQGENSIERAQGGLGIGLGLARSLVEMHGGTIEASSPGPGSGSEFVVRLPVAAEAPPAEEERAPAADGAAGAAADAAALRVLVVDDNQDAADSLSALLQLMGHEVRTAYDGIEAVTAAGSFAPDLVLLDIGLPKLNGYEAARRIREQPGGREMTLVAVTGWGQDDDKRRSREAGFNLHITKPLDPAILKRLLVRSSSERLAR